MTELAGAVAELDRFIADHRGDPLAWVACPVLYSVLVITHEPGPLGRRGGPATVARRAYALGRTGTRLGELTGRLVSVDGVLFAALTENHRRSLRPVIEAAERGSSPSRLLEPAIDRRELARSLRRAGVLAGELIDRLRRSRVSFLRDERRIFTVFAEAARSLAVASSALRSMQPSAVVLATNHGPDARALTLLSRRDGFPTVYVPHAPLLRDVRMCDMPFDYAALRGQLEVDWFVARGADEDRVVAAGNPALTPPPQPVAIDADAAVVLALSPDDGEIVRAVVQSTLEAVGDRVIVAPHPRQDLAFLRSIVPPAWRFSVGRTYDQLRESGPSAVVQYSSGVGLESMLLGIPTIELSLFGKAPSYPFLDSELLTVARSAQELPGALTAARARSRDAEFRDAVLAWARSWCARAGADAADAAWRLVATARASGPAPTWIWEAWPGPDDHAAATPGLTTLASTAVRR